MNIEHFTEKAREAINDAARVAREHNHNQVEVEHLLAALLAQEGGVVQQIIAKVGGNISAAQRRQVSPSSVLPCRIVNSPYAARQRGWSGSSSRDRR